MPVCLYVCTCVSCTELSHIRLTWNIGKHWSVTAFVCVWVWWRIWGNPVAQFLRTTAPFCLTKSFSRSKNNGWSFFTLWFKLWKVIMEADSKLKNKEEKDWFCYTKWVSRVHFGRVMWDVLWLNNTFFFTSSLNWYNYCPDTGLSDSSSHLTAHARRPPTKISR